MTLTKYLFVLLVFAGFVTSADAQICNTASKDYSKSETKFDFSASFLFHALKDRRGVDISQRLSEQTFILCRAIARSPEAYEDRLGAPKLLGHDITQNWSGTEWEDEARALYNYSEAGLVAESIFQDLTEGVWTNVIQRLNSYNERDQLVETIRLEWDGARWVDNSRSTTYYDNNGYYTDFILEVTDGIGSWLPIYRTTVAGTDHNGNPLEWLNEFYQGGAWFPDVHVRTTYDDQSRITSFEVLGYNNGQWERRSQGTTIYSEGESLSVFEGWINGGWQVFDRTTDKYDGEGRLVETLSEAWTGTAWEKQARQLRTYEGGGNEIELLFEIWGGGAWSGAIRDTSTYDSDGDIVEFVSQDWNGQSWQNRLRHLYAYHAVTATANGFSVPETAKLAVYPSPVRNNASVFVTLTEPGTIRVEVFDVLGRRVAILADEQAPSGTNRFRWSVDHLTAGVYWVRMQSGNVQVTRPIAVVR